MQKQYKNRFGHVLKVGQKVSFHLARGGVESGTIAKFDATSDFAKAYGVQVSFSDSGYRCTIDDCSEPAAALWEKAIAETPAKGFYSWGQLAEKGKEMWRAKV